MHTNSWPADEIPVLLEALIMPLASTMLPLTELLP